MPAWSYGNVLVGHSRPLCSRWGRWMSMVGRGCPLELEKLRVFLPFSSTQLPSPGLQLYRRADVLLSEPRLRAASLSPPHHGVRQTMSSVLSLCAVTAACIIQRSLDVTPCEHTTYCYDGSDRNTENEIYSQNSDLFGLRHDLVFPLTSQLRTQLTN